MFFSHFFNEKENYEHTTEFLEKKAMAVYLYCTCLGECQTHKKNCRNDLYLGDIDNICKSCTKGRKKIGCQKRDTDLFKNIGLGADIYPSGHEGEDDCICEDRLNESCRAQNHWKTA